MGRNLDKPRTVEDAIDKAKPWQLAEIVDPANCRSVTMPDNADSSFKVCCMFKFFVILYIISHMAQFLHTIQVVRLLYTNSGVGLLALGSNGIQKLWKWTRSEQNPSGKVLAWTAFDMHLLISISFLRFICRYISFCRHS